MATRLFFITVFIIRVFPRLFAILFGPVIEGTSQHVTGGEQDTTDNELCQGESENRHRALCHIDVAREREPGRRW